MLLRSKLNIAVAILTLASLSIAISKDFLWLFAERPVVSQSSTNIDACVDEIAFFDGTYEMNGETAALVEIEKLIRRNGGSEGMFDEESFDLYAKVACGVILKLDSFEVGVCSLPNNRVYFNTRPGIGCTIYEQRSREKLFALK